MKTSTKRFLALAVIVALLVINFVWYRFPEPLVNLLFVLGGAFLGNGLTLWLRDK